METPDENDALDIDIEKIIDEKLNVIKQELIIHINKEIERCVQENNNKNKELLDLYKEELNISFEHNLKKYLEDINQNNLENKKINQDDTAIRNEMVETAEPFKTVEKVELVKTVEKVEPVKTVEKVEPVKTVEPIKTVRTNERESLIKTSELDGLVDENEKRLKTKQYNTPMNFSSRKAARFFMMSKKIGSDVGQTIKKENSKQNKSEPAKSDVANIEVRVIKTKKPMALG